ncbi:MAG: FixJ family two-component response regulator [Desulforhopalus sp.]
MSDKSILLVDDEESILSSISWILEKNNFKVTKASSGQEAIDKLEDTQYELVITDLIMANVNGLAVLKHAKKLYPDIGVMILTGQGDISTAVEAIKMGADDYLEKPCDYSDLLHKATRSFEKQDLVVKLRRQNQQLKSEVVRRKIIEAKLEELHVNLESQVEQRTTSLIQAVDELQSVLATLRIREQELEAKNQELRDTNTTLNTLLKRREREHNEIRLEVAEKAVKMVLPLLKKADKNAVGPTKDYILTAQANLLDVFSQHPHDTQLTNAKLAPRELQIVHYIRQNKTNKEMADILGIRISTVESYRENIRKKLRIKNKKINLKKFLTSTT